MDVVMLMDMVLDVGAVLDVVMDVVMDVGAVLDVVMDVVMDVVINVMNVTSII